MLSLSNLKAPTPQKPLPERRAEAIAALDRAHGADQVTIALEKLAKLPQAKRALYLNML